MKKFKFDEVKQYVENLGYELISKEYINIKEKLILKDKNGYYYMINFDNLKHGDIPLLAHKSNPYSIQNIKLFIKNNNPNFVLISDKYEGKNVHLTIKDKCGYYYSISFHNLKNHGLNPLFVSTYNPYSIQNIKLFLKINNCNYTLLTEKYTNEITKLILTDNNGYLYTKTWTALQRLNDFHIASDDNLYSIINIKLWCKLHNKKFELLSTEYINNSNDLIWKCLEEECKEVFYMSWDHISRDCGCGYCDGKQVGLSNCLATKNPELAKEWHTVLNGNLTPYDVTLYSGKKVWWKCKVCNHEWPASIANRSNGRGCPKCNESKGEKECKRVFISKELISINQDNYDKLLKTEKNNNIYFIPQMKFDRLLGLGGCLLSYDFYIPILNLIIEYDGEYHYMPIKKYKNEPMKDAEERFRKQQIHDKLKNEYCKKHNIKLLRIPYWDFDNIEKILTKELNIISDQLQNAS